MNRYGTIPQEDNLLGKKHGKLTVIAPADSARAGRRRWLCECECGNTTVVDANNLKRNHTRSCGCAKSNNLTGQVFGNLTVLGRSDKRAPRGKRTVPLWECRCECGTITYKATDILKNSNTSMCSRCAEIYAAENARRGAGFVEGTQLSRITNMNPIASNTSGCRGVYYEKSVGKWRARLKFKGKIMNFGSYEKFEDAVAARKCAEEQYFGAFIKKINGEDNSDAETVCFEIVGG